MNAIASDPPTRAKLNAARAAVAFVAATGMKAGPARAEGATPAGPQPAKVSVSLCPKPSVLSISAMRAGASA